MQNEQDARIHHLSRLIIQQEQLLEKTRQLNDKKYLVYFNIALILAVVGLALGLRKSDDKNDKTIRLRQILTMQHLRNKMDLTIRPSRLLPVLALLLLE